MQLNQLIESMGVAIQTGEVGVEITQLTDDSRRVSPGALFIARSGQCADGAAYIDQAIERGAVAVLAPPGCCGDLPAQIVRLEADTVDQALASRLAERFFDQPSRKLALIGVTGTNGKTTVAFAIQHLLLHFGVKTGMIGTVLIDDGAQRRRAELTTPGPIDLSDQLARMAANGCRAAALEISSHALDQGRSAGLQFKAGVFTNLTGDHLDYHETMDAYAAAKAKLFEQLSDQGVGVINADDPLSQTMAQACRGEVRWCTLGDSLLGDRSCRAEVLELCASHSRARFVGPWGDCDVRLPMIGRHNVYNALQAAAAAYTIEKFDADQLVRALAHCPIAPGRLEPVTADWPNAVGRGEEKSADFPAVLVDYAHTHDALKNVLTALRSVTAGRLIVLFGCGGDRDRTKRPKMAAVVRQLADCVIISNDNPRTEDPERIIDDILKGAPDTESPKSSTLQVEPDRAKAIALAIGMAQGDDTVLIAGKGHEDYQILGSQTIHFDDRQQASKALRRRRKNMERA